MQHLFLAAALAAATVIPASAQDKLEAPQEKPPTNAAAKPPVPLKLTVVLARFQGEKKISSLPYTTGVLANGRQTNMRMGITVPIPTVVTSASKTDTAASTPVTSYQYRDVGTNIDCEASDAGNGGYSLRITIEDSSIQADTGAAAAKPVRDAPVFRSFQGQLQHAPARRADDAVRVGDGPGERGSDADRCHPVASEVAIDRKASRTPDGATLAACGQSSRRAYLVLWSLIACGGERQSPQGPTPIGGAPVWADEFDRDGLPDRSRWDYEVGFIRNNERQYYTRERAENARVENGLLVIEARRERFEGADYTSASLTSRASWTYGRNRGSGEAAARARDVAGGLDARREHRRGRVAGVRRDRHHGARRLRSRGACTPTSTPRLQPREEDQQRQQHPGSRRRRRRFTSTRRPGRRSSIDMSVDGRQYFTFAKEPGGDSGLAVRQAAVPDPEPRDRRQLGRTARHRRRRVPGALRGRLRPRFWQVIGSGSPSVPPSGSGPRRESDSIYSVFHAGDLTAAPLDRLEYGCVRATPA